MATTSMALSTLLTQVPGAAKKIAQIMSSLRKNPLEMVGDTRLLV